MPNSISFQTVKDFRISLNKRKKQLLLDNKVVSELARLKVLLDEFEDTEVQKRAGKAAEELSAMSEEERRMLSMLPAERKFFLSYKARNPENPWGYFKAYQQEIQKAYQAKRRKTAAAR